MTDIPADIPALIQQCAPNVAVQTLQPLISVESAKRPHAIGYKVVARDGAVFRLTSQPKNSAEAQQWARWMLERGYRFDAGIAQINTVNFKRTGLTPETMFDPCVNIRAGAQVLTDCYRRALPRFRTEQEALRAALSCYQSGNFKTGFATGYVAKILAAAKTQKPLSSTSVYQSRPTVVQVSTPPLKHEGELSTSRRRSSVNVQEVPDLYNVSSVVPGWGAESFEGTPESSESKNAVANNDQSGS